MADLLETQSDDLDRLAGEQAALRHVATLAASGVPAQELFEAVSEEVGRLLAVDIAALSRYEPEGVVSVVAAWSRAGDQVPAPGRWSLGGVNLSTIVAQTERPARIECFDEASDDVGGVFCDWGIRSAVGTPIVVDGRLWGLVTVGSRREQPLPADTEARLASFTDLVATAIANADSRTALAGLADEQAALRRVATLVARLAPPDKLFAAVNQEVGQLLSVDIAGIGRYESNGNATEVAELAAWSKAGDTLPGVGSRWALGGRNVPTLVAQTGRAARIDRYCDASGPLGDVVREAGINSAVGTPILVDGRLWGVIVVASTLDTPLPADSEARLAAFTELVATAIANAESRVALARLAEEQAALRRVATLVARGAPAEEVFAAVTKEVGQLLGLDPASMSMSRYNPDGTMTVLAVWRGPAGRAPTGARWALGGNNVPTLVTQTGRPARTDTLADDSGPIGLAARERGVRSQVGTPIVVDGRLWGVMMAGSTLEQPLPADTEARLAAFTELVAVAIANAESHAELTASRARIVAAADEARRRIERDLHDGAQQRLVSLGLQLRAVQASATGLGELDGELSSVVDGLASVQDELRVIARGIHPAILAHGGLRPVLKTLARRSPIPVEFDMRADVRLAERIEVAAYYVVSETLTNAAKHAQASAIQVVVEAVEGALRVRIRDNGVGGADPTAGSGLVGLKDRIETLGGTITIDSPLGAGTTVQVALPLND